MLVSEFDYDLPKDRIAHAPCAERGDSKLMILSRNESGVQEHTFFKELSSFLNPGDLLVLNNTRVIPARIETKKPTGGRVELLFLEQKHSQESEQEVWLAMTKSSRPVRADTILSIDGNPCLRVVQKLDNGYCLVSNLDSKPMLDFLKEHGELPLPPYINPEEGVSHEERYQTVYAKHLGAVAAPTAGLHFSKEQLLDLEKQGVRLAYVSLHVGAGTFLPVRVEDIKDHEMHHESYEIPESTAKLWQETKAKGNRVIAVGTTSLRAIEATVRRDGKLTAGHGRTDIFIYPGYKFQSLDALITNFHLPCSTLLMLVAAFHGKERILKAYQTAIEKKYRFYSYGDAMIIL